MRSNGISKIACVIVTYNNGDNIEKLLDSLFSQSKPIEEIIVVDNASSDVTTQIIKKRFPVVTLMANSINTGVGGGYAQGMEYAVQKGYAWIWLLDGDSLPQISALEQLVTAYGSLLPVHPRIGILASSPTNPSTGQIYGGFTRTGLFYKVPIEITHFKKPVPVDTVMSSGCLISDKVVRDVGLPRADFFMDFADAEYNFRILRKGYEIISVPASVIYHRLGEPRVTTSRFITSAIRLFFAKKDVPASHPAWRYYYGTRNELYTFWHEFRSYKALFRLMLETAGMILGIIIFNDDEKFQRFRYIFRGLKDGFKGKMGKTVIPPGEASVHINDLRNEQ